jgi:hypothetical protein
MLFCTSFWCVCIDPLEICNIHMYTLAWILFAMIVTHVKNPVINHEGGKERKTPRSSVTQPFLSGKAVYYGDRKFRGEMI